jgi:hypothetical protein
MPPNADASELLDVDPHAPVPTNANEHTTIPAARPTRNHADRRLTATKNKVALPSDSLIPPSFADIPSFGCPVVRKCLKY